MKMRIYNKLILLFLSVCSFLFVCFLVNVSFAQLDKTPLLLRYYNSLVELNEDAFPKYTDFPWTDIVKFELDVFGEGSLTVDLSTIPFKINNVEIPYDTVFEIPEEYVNSTLVDGRKDKQSKIEDAEGDDVKVDLVQGVITVTVTEPTSRGQAGVSTVDSGVVELEGVEVVGSRSATQYITEGGNRGGGDRVLHLYTEGVFGKGGTITLDSGDSNEVGGSIRRIFNQLFSIIFTISGTLMVVLLAVHGFKMIYAEFDGSPIKVGEERKRVEDVAIGAVILLLSWVVLNFIDPSLLRPKLFETITQLRQVTDGRDVITTDITVDKNGVEFSKERGSFSLTVTACPKIESKFRQRLIEIRDSLVGSSALDGRIEYAYMILFSSAADNQVYFYDAGNNDTVTAGDLKKRFGAGAPNSGGQYIICERRNNNVKLYRQTSSGKEVIAGNSMKISFGGGEGTIKVVPDVVALFPVVFIVDTREAVTSPSGGGERKRIEKTARSWRGVPWRHADSLTDREREDALSLLGRDVITLIDDYGDDDEIHAVEGEVGCPGRASTIHLPRISVAINKNNEKPEYVGYTVLPFDGSENITYNGATTKDKIIPSGNVKFILPLEHESIFSVTPVVKVRSVKKLLRGIPSCFKISVKNERNLECIFALKKLDHCRDAGSSAKVAATVNDFVTYAETILSHSYIGGEVGAEKVSSGGEFFTVSLEFDDVKTVGWKQKDFPAEINKTPQYNVSRDELDRVYFLTSGLSPEVVWYNFLNPMTLYFHKNVTSFRISTLLSIRPEGGDWIGSQLKPVCFVVSDQDGKRVVGEKEGECLGP